MVEPHLDVLIERFDDIEPHLEFCLEHADVVVPHLNEIVEYLDDILFFARERVLWTRLEPLLPQLVVRLPALGPHLPNLRRHAKLVLPYLPLLAHHADRLAPFLPISQHADALVHYLGWALQVPGLHRFLYLPGVGRALSYLAVRLPFSGAVREKSDMQHLGERKTDLVPAKKRGHPAGGLGPPRRTVQQLSLRPEAWSLASRTA
ncbi:unnamed protein product [Durusdinium trenchii]|uniref:Uncharacterized protein n=1 Tax=Durusdinium trenchii TaxID=1381693 RepID=A0ABP0S7V9_9DINO